MKDNLEHFSSGYDQSWYFLITKTSNNWSLEILRAFLPHKDANNCNRK